MMFGQVKFLHMIQFKKLFDERSRCLFLDNEFLVEGNAIEEMRQLPEDESVVRVLAQVRGDLLSQFWDRREEKYEIHISVEQIELVRSPLLYYCAYAYLHILVFHFFKTRESACIYLHKT